MLRRDWIQRMIEQLARFLAAIAGARRRGAHDEAAQQIDAAAASVAGVDLAMIAAVGSESVALQVREPARLAALARLVHERAELDVERGDDAAARRWRARAAELWLEAALAGGVLDEIARAAIAACPPDALGPRHRAARARLAGGAPA